MAEETTRFDRQPSPPGTRFACAIEYDGSAYNGWQAQPHQGDSTVQAKLESALASVANMPMRVHCAGRTDAGVHGCGQVVHFDAPVARSPKAWVMGVNANLPPDIRVHWSVPVPPDFHARFSALSRRYCYLIANTPIRPALMRNQVSWYRYPLATELMEREAQCLLGEQDFSAFRAASCQSASPMRQVQALQVTRRGTCVEIQIEANAFLHHMVRNIAGSLLAVGSGRKPAGWIAGVLASRDRRNAADTASASGLYLVEVSYPQRFGLPGPPGVPSPLGNW